jgi:hypothetical protein
LGARGGAAEVMRALVCVTYQHWSVTDVTETKSRLHHNAVHYDLHMRSVVTFSRFHR